MKLGKAKYGGKGGSYTKKKYAKLKDGEQSYRILPPMGDLAEKGIWSVYYNVHYGYVNTKGELRAFASPLVKNRKTKMIEVPCAATERLQKMKAQYEEAKKSGNTAVADRLAKLVGGMKPKFNLDSNHYMNALDEQGNIVILALRYKAKQALDIEIKALRDAGIDPLSPEQGRYFVFRRSGTGLTTDFKVSVKQRTINVPNVGEVKQDIVHVLDEGTIGRLEQEAGQLDRLFKTPTSEEVARIVSEGATAVDEILNARQAEATEEVVDLEEEILQEAVQSLPTEVQQSIKEKVTAAVAATPGATEALGQETVTKAAAAVTPAAEAVNNMSEEEFLKSMGLA